MKVIYISYDGMTDSLGQSQVIPYLLGLSKKGHTIHIISCEKKLRFEKQNKYIKTLLDSNNIFWFPVPYSTLPSVLAKQLNLLRIKQKAYELCQNEKIDLIHCRSYMAALIGLQLKNKFGVKFIFDMRGLWADERLDGNIWNLKNKIHKRIYHYFKKKEIEFLLNADYTISLTQNAKDEILSWKQFKNQIIPIEIIPCCVDLNLFSIKNIDTLLQENIKNKIGITKDDFVISYLGSIGTWYMLDEMLDFFNRLLLQKPNSKFLFITNEDRGVMVEKAKKLGISKEKLIIKAATRQEVNLYLCVSDVSIYFIKPVYSKKASSPTKTGEIMAMGIPIITNTGVGDSDKFIVDSGAGMLINKFSNEEYDRIIKQIDILLQKDKKQLRATAEHYFSLEKGIELYHSVYQKTISINKSI